PFGTGPFSGESNGVTSGINLIASLASLGFFGVLMQLLLMSGWSFALDRASVQRVVCCLPVLITALTSQPLVGAPMVYLIALCVISREAVAGQGAPMLLKSFRGRKFVFRRQT
ncbi:MAG TPA: hypothetical protein VLJ58_21465, partial [Ramlibacter sp.]|nr:hypothetical protein [Ramlibacter sp.]